MRVRLLPTVLFFGGLLFTVRVGALWDDISVTAGTRGAAETVNDPAKPAAGAPAKTPAKAAAEAPAKAPADLPAGPPGEAAAPAAAPAAERADPFSYTDEEIEILQSLAKRRDALDVRDRALQQRAALLAAAEQRMDQKLADLKALQATIEKLVAQHNDEEEKKFKSLVKIYENMKPRDAAQIFEQLEMDVLLEVVSRMSERKAAPILAKMDPARAKEVTLQLAQRRELPFPK